VKKYFLIIITCVCCFLIFACKPSPKNLILSGDQKKNALDFSGAILDYSAALIDNPLLYQAWLNRGECQMKLGQFELAIADFDQALLLKPNFAVALYNKGSSLMKIKKYNEALQYFQQASVIDTSINCSMALAECNFYAGKNKQAIRYFNEAIVEMPDSIEILLGRGLANYQLGNNQNCIADFNTYLLAGGTNPLVYRQLGLIYLKSASLPSQLDSTILFLEQYKGKANTIDNEASKAIVLAYLSRGKILMQTEKEVEAMADFTKVIELDPTNAEAYLQRGKIMISVGQNFEGCTDLQNALKYGNTNAKKLMAIYCKEEL
jgi:tetratricopeptide (TPR) repeat protein